MMISFSQLKNILKCDELQLAYDHQINHVSMDSRKAIISSNTLFFARKGPNNDGHDYIKDLYRLGIKNFVIEKDIHIYNYPEANFIKCGSSLQALQELASFKRKQFNAHVIGITGSNGKTIVKEWLLQLLSARYKIAATPHSFNSQLGVPLSVWLLDENHDVGIFEAGISQKDEMRSLAEIIKPTIGIMTNIGSAHDEGFESREEKILEKLVFFSSCQRLIYCKDHTEIDRQISDTPLARKALSWGHAANSDIKILGIDKKTTHAHVDLLFGNSSYSLDIPVTDPASLENALHCIATLILFEYNNQDIQDRIRLINPIAMRLELKRGINSCYIIDDSYNNDIAGLKIALDFLAQQRQKNRKTIILSDIFQSGMEGRNLYTQVNQLLVQHKINRMIAVGREVKKWRACFDIHTEFYDTTEELLQNFEKLEFREEMILVKGARSFAFERIVNRLQEKIHGTRLEINLGAVTHNLNFYRSRLNKKTKVMVMVKAFAYGTGMYEIANLLQYHKVDYLGVAYTDEGVNLRKNGIHIPILIMNPSPEGYEKLVEYNLEPEVYSFELLNDILAHLEGRPLNIHLKLDTGMHRLGFSENQLEMLIDLLKQHTNIKISGMFSHLAAADEEEHHAFSHQQANNFERLSNRIIEELNIQPLRHLLNSPGIIRYPQYQFDMVRLGIGLYGIDPSNVAQSALMPISSLKTIISQIRDVEPGNTVGYGRKGSVTKPTTIATIAIGYADGYSRFFSNGRGKVLVNGQLAPVIGNVCMDMTMIDITGIDARVGDDVVIFGKQPKIADLASNIGTIPYEILTNVSERVKRIYLYE